RREPTPAGPGPDPYVLSLRAPAMAHTASDAPATRASSRPELGVALVRLGKPGERRGGPPDPLVGEAGGPRLVRVEQVPAVDDQRPRHRLAVLGACEPLQLGPLGHDHGRVGAGDRLERGRADHRALDQVARAPDGLPRAYRR